MTLLLLGQDEESEGEEDKEDDEVEEEITRNWSVLKSTPQLRKSKVPSLQIQ